MSEDEEKEVAKEAEKGETKEAGEVREVREAKEGAREAEADGKMRDWEAPNDISGESENIGYKKKRQTVCVSALKHNHSFRTPGLEPESEPSGRVRLLNKSVGDDFPSRSSACAAKRSELTDMSTRFISAIER